jgi:hypothetical protein
LRTVNSKAHRWQLALLQWLARNRKPVCAPSQRSPEGGRLRGGSLRPRPAGCPGIQQRHQGASAMGGRLAARALRRGAAGPAGGGEHTQREQLRAEHLVACQLPCDGNNGK